MNEETQLERIVIDSDVLVGKPVVRGTRLSVEFVVGLLAHGWSEEQVLANYSGLTSEDVRACLAYATSLLESEKVYRLVV